MKVYILLTRSKTILSRAIHAVSGNKYTHASISFTGRRGPWYSYTRKDERFLFPAGWAQERVVFNGNRKIPYALYSLEVTEEQYRRAVRVEELSRQFRFDVTGLFDLAIGCRPSAKDAYFCSQFVSHILRESGIHAFKKPDNCVRPIDFMIIPGIKLEDSGLLSKIGARRCK